MRIAVQRLSYLAGVLLAGCQPAAVIPSHDDMAKDLALAVQVRTDCKAHKYDQLDGAKKAELCVGADRVLQAAEIQTRYNEVEARLAKKR